MARSMKIMRKSIHTFLHHYHYFTLVAAVFALPFALSLLLSHTLLRQPHHLLTVVSSRLRQVFAAAGFPSSGLLSLFNIKLSQTIFCSIFTYPFVVSFLLLAKSAVIQFLITNPRKFRSFSSLFSTYSSLFPTQICSTFVIFSANSICFCMFLLGFSFIDGLGGSSSKWVLFFWGAGAVVYAVVIANAVVVCSLAVVVSGAERIRGLVAILRSCALVMGRASTALSLALTTNLGLAAVEALFRFRILESYNNTYYEGHRCLLILEALFIGYLYSILIVLDVIMGCKFYESCKREDEEIEDGNGDLNVNEEECYYICDLEKLKKLEDFA